MDDELDALAARLTDAQREALVECVPWDVCVGAGIAVAFCANGFLQDSTILDDGVELTPLGLALRKRLMEKNNAG